MLALAFVMLAQAGIRQVDFQNFSYATCFTADDQTIRVTKGEYEKRTSGLPPEFFRVEGVDYGDLDGDGADEALVEVLCSGGGTGRFSDGLIFKMVAGRPKLIATLGAGDRAMGGISGLQIAGRLILADRYNGVSGACCPDWVERYEYRLTPAGVTSKRLNTEFVTADGDFAAIRVRFPRGAFGTTIRTRRNQESHLIGATAGQTLTLNITGANCEFVLTDPNNNRIVPQPELALPYTLKLAVTGDYRLSLRPTKIGCDVKIGIR